MSEEHSIKIAHLSMVQGIITRMSSNSFTLKALTVSFATALTAVVATADSPSLFYLLSALIPIGIFWILDARYLKLEKCYRELFDHIRTGGEIEAYSMSVLPYEKEIAPTWRLAISWSIVWFYLAVAISMVLVSAIIINNR